MCARLYRLVPISPILTTKVACANSLDSDETRNNSLVPISPILTTKVACANSLDSDETRLTRIKAVWHSNNIIRKYERQRSTLKIEAGEKCSRQQFIKLL